MFRKLLTLLVLFLFVNSAQAITIGVCQKVYFTSDLIKDASSVCNLTIDRRQIDNAISECTNIGLASDAALKSNPSNHYVDRLVVKLGKTETCSVMRKIFKIIN